MIDRQKILNMLLCAVALLFFANYVFNFVNQAFDYAINLRSDYFADGTFQLFNPMRRMATGQTPGHDFQFFHGLGVLYIHYPLFVAFGNNLFASELARQLLSPLLFVAANVWLACLFTRNFTGALLGGALMGLAINLFFTDINNTLILASMTILGVRSVVPVFTAGLIIWLNVNNKPFIASKSEKFHYQTVLIGSALALCFFCGTEQGIAALLAYLIYVTAFSGNAWNVKAKNIVILLLAFGLGIVFLYSLSSGRYWPEPLRFALFELPSDQFWYFGAPPNYFISTWADIIPFAKGHSEIPLDARWYVFSVIGTGLAMLGFTAYHQLQKPSAYTAGLLFLLMTGLFSNVSQLGYFGSSYAAPLFRAIVITVFYFTLHFLKPVYAKFQNSFRTWVAPQVLHYGFMVILGAIGVLYGSKVWAKATWLVQDVRKDRSGSKQTAGVYLNDTWQSHVDFVRDKVRSQSFWSVFAGLTEHELGTFNPTADYIFHALGPVRRPAYLGKFLQTKPAFVRTENLHIYDPGMWLLKHHWHMYRQILDHYRILHTNYNGVIWEKTDEKPWQTEHVWEDSLTGLANQQVIVLPFENPNADSLLYEVEVQYNVDNPYRGLPLLGGLPRHLLEFEHCFNNQPVSLPPYLQSFTFPILCTGYQKPTIKLFVKPHLSGCSFSISTIRYRKFVLKDAVKTYLFDPTCSR